MKKSPVVVALTIAMIGAAQAVSRAEHDERVNTAIRTMASRYAIMQHDGLDCESEASLVTGRAIHTKTVMLMYQHQFQMIDISNYLHEAGEAYRRDVNYRRGCLDGAGDRADRYLKMLDGWIAEMTRTLNEQVE